MLVCRFIIRDNLARHPGQRLEKRGKEVHRDRHLGLLFRVDEPVPVIHFHFSYKKHKDNFVFQIKNRIFASRNLLLI